MYRAFVFRLEPTQIQMNQFKNTFGAVRYIYNKMLEHKKAQYIEWKHSNPHTKPLEKEKTIKQYKEEYKKSHPDSHWLDDVDSLALANARKHLLEAFQRFYRVYYDAQKQKLKPRYDTKGPKIYGFPRFKRKKALRQSYTTNSQKGSIRIVSETGDDGKERHYLLLPHLGPVSTNGKHGRGRVRIRCHRPIPEGWTLRSVTITLTPTGKYMASLLFYCDSQAVKKTADPKAMLSFPLTISDLLTRPRVTTAFLCTDENHKNKRVSLPASYQKSILKLERKKEALNRCQPHSRRRQKKIKDILRLQEHIRMQRKDFLHKISTQLAHRYGTLFIRPAPQLADMPMFRERIYQTGWTPLRSFLAYKMKSLGKSFVDLRNDTMAQKKEASLLKETSFSN